MLKKGIRSVFRGQLSLGRATREAFRRGRAAVQSRRERATLDELAAEPARLRPEFQNLSSSDLLKHFRERSSPSFLPGFELLDSTASRQRELFANETERLIESARAIAKDHRWPLLGFGEREFGAQINWHRDPLSGRIWPRDYHADISLWHNDGSDIRVLWELNRLGHLIMLGRAYTLTKEEDFAAEFFAQLKSWREQNAVARGANWSCAMEVALRAMNLLAAFSLFRNSPELNEARLLMMLTMFDQHGAHIRRNLEFSHVATSNHYLSNLAGLLWIAIMLPELRDAEEWRKWALNELLREMDKQILPDGADYEGSTGYHCFVLELVLYSFVLCRTNEVGIKDKYWRKLHSMLVYLRGLLRPDGFMPLIGDTDGGQVLRIVPRAANDGAYLLALGAAVFKDAQFKDAQEERPLELWILGEPGLREYDLLANAGEEVHSHASPDAGTYMLRHEDLSLLFNARGAQNGRPTSHQHNDLLSVEISACGRAFIVDAGTYVYTADLHERQLFRSTAYHSTVQIDDEEQQTIREEVPFGNGGEAAARISVWETTPERDRVVAEHDGYERFNRPVAHRRSITFDKTNRWWLIEDELLGISKHKIATRFHFDTGLDVTLADHNSVIACDEPSGACLIIRPLDLDQPAELEAQFTSRHYGSKTPSLSACWTITTEVPCKFRWAIVPVGAGEDRNERLRVLEK
ncbi:MAG: alginate lyase family protein [bacterium]